MDRKGGGNWHVCQAAVETVFRGGTLRPLSELNGLDAPTATTNEASEAEVACTDIWRIQDPNSNWRSFRSNNKVSSGGKRKRSEELVKLQLATNLDLRLTLIFLQKASENRRQGSPSVTSKESGTTAATEGMSANLEGNRVQIT